jgi:NADPH-dependent 2,4-dienoyl-CoA reductase/sulfur reductase-like enzyme/rhodanese-related sulfurtransferase
MTTSRRIVIIGGVAAGMSTATRLRRLDEQAEIIVLERGGHVSFANCGLAYHVGGVIPDRESLLLQTPERLAARYRLDVRVNSEVTAIDPEAQTVTVHGSALSYDELVIATGSAPIIPDLPGAEHLLPLRSIEDTDRLSAAVSGLPAGAPIVVAGAGFIGLELVENLSRLGFAVTLVQRDGHVLQLDPEMAVIVEDRIRETGVDLRLSTTFTEVTADGVTLDDGTVLPSALTLAAIGVRAESTLARAAGIATGPSGAIVVDDQHRTSAAHVWAVGDVAEKVSAIDGSARPVMLAGPANRDGRYLADAMMGADGASKPAWGTAILELFGLTIASFGATERALAAADRAVRIIHTHPASHATYYPGAETMSIKLIVNAVTDAILGAQIIGAGGVDKRLDVLVTAASAGVTASALADLELAYAPQYGSAKDAINMLGYVARNRRDGLMRSIQWHELADELEAGAVLVDVRTPEEFAGGAIADAVNIPLDDLRSRVAEIADRRVIVHCQVGQRGHTAASLLTHLGIDAVNLDGGYRTWLTGHRSRQPQPQGAR